MSTPPSHPRSVKIAQDERTGWSSDRPRRDGAAPRPADLSTRCRVLSPTDRMRYSPGSLLLVVSPSPAERDRFVARLVEERSAVLSLPKVRELIRGRVPDEALDDRAQELLDAAVAKRLASGETVVVPAEGLDPAERERYLRPASGLRRPRHIIFLDSPQAEVPEGDRPAVNDLRRQLDAGELGQEGFQTALRLGGRSIPELKSLVFRPAPKDD